MTDFSGKVFKYGDNVNTDVLIPARYLNDASEQNLRTHALEDLDAEFAASVQQGDVIVGGINFGSGSSREHAPLAIKASGVRLVVAKSFARIFFRNAINIGLYIVESDDIADGLNKGDNVSFTHGTLTNETTGKCYILPKMDVYVQNILDKGGLLEAIRQ